MKVVIVFFSCVFAATAAQTGCSRQEFAGFQRGAISLWERNVAYSVSVGFAHLPPNLKFDISLDFHTANALDVQLLGKIQNITITPDECVHNLTIIVIPDGVAQEGNETFSLLITNFDASLLGENASFIGRMDITIIDSDDISFGLSEQYYEAEEGVNNGFLIKVVKHQKKRLATPVTLRVSTFTINEAFSAGVIPNLLTGVDQADEEDFTGGEMYVTFPADEDEKNITTAVSVLVPIVDDEVDEALQQRLVLTLELVDASSPTQVRVFGNRSLLTILDNENGCRIGFPQAEYQFSEPEVTSFFRNVTLIKEAGCVSERTYYVRISIAEPSTNIMAATMTTSPGKSRDFSFSLPEGEKSYKIAFPAGQQVLPLSFSLNANDIPERLEGFEISCTPEDEPGYPIFEYPRSTNQRTIILITDNDAAVVRFEKLSYSFHEGNGSQEVCVLVTNPPRHEELIFSIALNYHGTLVTADDEDGIEIAGGSVDFSAGSDERRKCFSVGITDDTLHELTESFLLTLGLAEGQSRVTIQQGIAEVFVLNDDNAVVGFERAQYTVREDYGTLQVCVRVSNPPHSRPLSIDINVDYSCSPGSATTDDFRSCEGSLHFSHGERRRCIRVAIIDDMVDEGSESFTVGIHLRQGQIGAHINSDTAEITIKDDDEPAIEPSIDPPPHNDQVHPSNESNASRRLTSALTISALTVIAALHT